MPTAELEPVQLPRTIDQVIARLNAILDDALRGARRIGYFTALYGRVTTNPPAGWGAIVSARDAEIAALGGLVYPPRGIAAKVEHWVREKESSDVRYNIQVVAG